LRRGIRFGKPSEGRRAGQANEETVWLFQNLERAVSECD
jgi:hypothetical protein